MKTIIRFSLSALVFGITAAKAAETGASTTTFTPLGQNSYRLDWIGEDGLTYFPQFSANLVDWFYLPTIDQGFVHDPIDVTPLDGENYPYPKYFMRLATSGVQTLDPKGADFDNDGINNWQELTVYGTDPLKFSTAGNGLPDGYEDTDADGIADQWERMLIDQSPDLGSMTLADIQPNGDFDGDGVSNLQEFLLGLSGYQVDTDGDGYRDRLSVDQSLFLRLDESAGILADDSSGGGFDGNLVGALEWQLSTGVSNGKLVFHGGADVVTIPPAALDSFGNVTVSFWFQTLISTDQTFLSAVSSNQLPSLEIGIEGGNLIRVNSPGGPSAAWIYPRSLADGLWHHLVLMRDTNTGQAILCLDGYTFGVSQSVSSGAFFVGAISLGQRHQTVSSYDPARAFSGSLDEVRIWSTALSESDVSELFRLNDLDQDGLPDDYELAKAGNLTRLSGSGNDADGDGKNDRLEFENGTNPTDYYNGQLPMITLVSGNGQTIYNSERTTAPLVFLVTNGSIPLVNAPVDLTHPGIVGALETLNGDQLASALTLRTDTSGQVSIHFKAD